MDTIQISGGKPLRGEVFVQGSKNAALPVLAATLLVQGMCVIHNCPQIADAALMIQLLQSIGCKVIRQEHTVFVDASVIKSTEMYDKYTEKMRSSVIFMGAMLGRMGEVTLGYPGGCVIGRRPIDLHIKAIRALGGEVEEKEGFLYARAEKLRGADISFSFPSVGATENTILAAVRAEGVTVIQNAAREPEIDALCGFLKKAGADIVQQADRIIIQGVKRLRPCEYHIPSDRIVAGTYLLGCMAAGGEIFLRNSPIDQMQAQLFVLEKMGAKLWKESDGIGILCKDRPNAVRHVQTKVYPGFPTDLQSPLLAALSLARGDSSVEETIFENRFRIVEPLKQMGADITQVANTAQIRGVESLTGARVTVWELRGGAGLVTAGLAAHGTTTILQSSYIDRGYENIVEDLRSLGADIRYGEAENEE